MLAKIWITRARWLSVALFVTSAFVAGCGRSARQSSAPVLGPDSVLNRLNTVGATMGGSRRDFVNRHGSPLRIRGTTSPNRHGAGTDSVFTLEYEQLRATILQSGFDRREFLVSVESENPNVALPGGLKIGTAVSRTVVERLGTPSSRAAAADTTFIRYEVPVPERNGLVTLVLVRDILRRVRWDPYVD